MSIVILTAGGCQQHRTKFATLLGEVIGKRGVNVVPMPSSQFVLDMDDIERTSNNLRAFAESVYGALQDSDPNMYVFDAAPVEPWLRLSYSNTQQHRELANELQEIVRLVTESSMTVVAPPIPASVFVEEPGLTDTPIDCERDADLVAFDAIRYDEMRRYMCAGMTSIELIDHDEWRKAFFDNQAEYSSWTGLAVKLTEASFDRSYESASEAAL